MDLDCLTAIFEGLIDEILGSLSRVCLFGFEFYIKRNIKIKLIYIKSDFFKIDIINSKYIYN